MAKDLTEYYKEYHKARYQANKELYLARSKAYREANREKFQEYDRVAKIKNRHKLNAAEAKRRAMKLNATPKWLTEKQLEEIDKIYSYAKDMGYHVDHIVPLKNKLVCGMHVPWNLQAIPAAMNLTKSNKFKIE